MIRSFVFIFFSIGFCFGQETERWQHEFDCGYAGFNRYKHGYDIQYSFGRIFDQNNVVGIKPGFLFLNNFKDYKYLTVKVFYERYFTKSGRFGGSVDLGLATWRNEVSNMAWRIGIFNTNKELALNQKYFFNLNIKYSLSKNIILSGGAFIVFGHAENNDSELYREEFAYRMSPRISICFNIKH